jgi:hypothetical protein
VSGLAVAECANIFDTNSRQLCRALAGRSAAECAAISTLQGRQFCRGLVTKDASQCAPQDCTVRAVTLYRTPGAYALKEAKNACVRVVAPVSCAGVVDPFGHVTSLLRVDYQGASVADPSAPYGSRYVPKIEDVCEDPTDNNWIAWPRCPAGTVWVEQTGGDVCAVVQ